jgi:hypothetical protein
MFRPPKCEAPKLGEAFTRDDSDLGKEHALIVYVRVRGDHWDALLLTDNGHHPLSSSDFVVPRAEVGTGRSLWSMGRRTEEEGQGSKRATSGVRDPETKCWRASRDMACALSTQVPCPQV